MKNQKEIKKSIPFTTATKRIKHLGINLPKETKELYTENYKKEDPIPKERRPGGDTQRPRSGVVAWRSHPPSEARGGGQEEPPRFWGAVAVCEQEGLEELSYVEGQKVWQ